ncbi:MAG: hypothetical protein NVSMB6_10190 [Burkholderiaceae bacterium]
MIKFHAILVSSLVFGVSSIAFAADNSPTNARAAPVGGETGKPTHAQHEAAEDSMKVKSKSAEAECKRLTGAKRSACEKDVEPNEKASTADIKASRK